VSATQSISGSDQGDFAGQNVVKSSTDAGQHTNNAYRGGRGLRPEILARIEKQFGFDKPAHERLWLMLKQYVQLDFGVSYFTARQQADHLLIAEEQRRRVVQVLLQDVRRAYWRAASAQALSARIRTAIRDAEAALPAARKVETEGLRSPVDALRYQKALLDLLRQLEGVQELLAVSKTELASLINLPPSQNYSLAVPRMLQLQISSLPVREMEETALLLNPDIRD